MTRRQFKPSVLNKAHSSLSCIPVLSESTVLLWVAQVWHICPYVWAYVLQLLWFAKIHTGEYYPDFGQFIGDLVSKRRGSLSPCWDRAQISDYLPPDWCFWYFWCQIEWYADDDNGRIPAWGGPRSPNLGLSAPPLKPQMPTWATWS